MGGEEKGKEGWWSWVEVPTPGQRFEDGLSRSNCNAHAYATAMRHRPHQPQKFLVDIRAGNYYPPPATAVTRHHHHFYCWSCSAHGRNEGLQPFFCACVYSRRLRHCASSPRYVQSIHSKLLNAWIMTPRSRLAHPQAQAVAQKRSRVQFAYLTFTGL